jgi:hypothetical protein
VENQTNGDSRFGRKPIPKAGGQDYPLSNTTGKENTLEGWSDEDEGAGLISFGAENPKCLLERPALEKRCPLPSYWHNIHYDRLRFRWIPSRLF